MLLLCYLIVIYCVIDCVIETQQKHLPMIADDYECSLLLLSCWFMVGILGLLLFVCLIN